MTDPIAQVREALEHGIISLRGLQRLTGAIGGVWPDEAREALAALDAIEEESRFATQEIRRLVQRKVDLEGDGNALRARIQELEEANKRLEHASTNHTKRIQKLEVEQLACGTQHKQDYARIQELEKALREIDSINGDNVVRRIARAALGRE